MKLRQKKISIPSTILLFIFMLFLMTPFYVMLVGSLKNNISLITFPIDLSFTKELTFVNYRYVLEKSAILSWLLNSLSLSTAVALITCALASTAGYAFAKITFKGKNILFVLVLATMMLPKQILLIPNFLVAHSLDLEDKWTGVVLTTIAPAFGVFLCRQLMSSIPIELTDAAEIDGCGEIRKFFYIILPMALPAVGTVFIFSFFACFNDYIWQLIMISDKKLITLPIGIAMFSQAATSNKGCQLAVACIATLPLVLLFILCQKFFIKNVTAGAVKG